MSLNRPGRFQDHDGQRGAAGSGFNRRSFLRGSVAAASLVAPAKDAPVQDGNTATLVDGWVQLTLDVNGEPRTVKAEPRTTLLEVLRDQINLSGCKDVQVDGADTVLIDGRATYAGAALVLAARGKRIQTVESLRNKTQVDPVVAGFVKHDAMQRGFCTPGFVRATRAFLNKNPGATLERVRGGFGRNICRCGITACAMELAQQQASRGRQPPDLPLAYASQHLTERPIRGLTSPARP